MRKRHRRKSPKVVWGIGIGLLLLLGSWIGISCRQHAPSEFTSDSSLDHVVYYAQKDVRWKEDPLGDSIYHMGDSGCLTTCLAAVFQMQGIERDTLGETVNPKTLNQFFSTHGMYDAEGNLLWYALEDTLDMTVIRKEADELKEGELDTLLEQGCYPIACVHGAGTGRMHFVLLVGKADGVYWCMDPVQQEETAVPLSKYGNSFDSIRYLTENRT